MNALEVFDFDDVAVRVVVDESGQPWWVANDVCRCLDIANPRHAVARLDADERASMMVDTLGGQQDMSVINESGLYALIFTSKKEAARKFRKWVTHEVLPALRREGRYAIEPPAEPESPRLDAEQQDTWRTWLMAIDSGRRLFGIDGARHMWRQSPLPQPPDGVEGRTIANSPALDEVRAFINDRLERAEGERVKAASVWRAYQIWCARSGRQPLSRRAFGDSVRECGVKKFRSGSIWYVDVRLIDEQSSRAVA